MSKATNQALIDAIANGQPNTAEEARLAWTALNNELYPEVIKTSLSSPIGTAVLADFFTYSFLYSKQGNRVTLSGWFRNNLNSKPQNTALLSFTDSSYNAKNNGVITEQEFMAGDYKLKIVDGTIYNVTPLPLMNLSVQIQFNVTYFTND